MNDRPQQFTELALLIAALLDDTISEVQLDRLQDIVEQEVSAREFYVDALNLHAGLLWHLHPQAGSDASVPSIDEAGQRPSPARESKRQVAHSSIFRRFARPTPLSLTVAASVIGLLIVAMAFMAPPFYRSLTSSAGDASRDGYRIVAQITAMHAVQWSEGNTQRGLFLVPGRQLQIDAGIVEVTYRNGAEVALEGPCAYVVEELGRGQLDRGRLLARVPESAIGFRVTTPHVEITDLGTEFGVDVDEEGAGEISVLEGKIECSAGERREILSQGEGASITPSGAMTRHRQANTEMIAAMAKRVESMKNAMPTAVQANFTPYAAGGATIVGETQFNPSKVRSGFAMPAPLKPLADDLLQTHLARITRLSLANFDQLKVHDGDATAGAGDGFEAPGWGENTAIFHLDVARHPQGYDIREIRLFTGGRDDDRWCVSQAYTIQVQPVAHAGTNQGFVDLQDVVVQPQGGKTTGGILLTRTFESGGGAIATGISAIAIDGRKFRGNQRITNAAWQEIDIIGRPNAEPNTE